MLDTSDDNAESEDRYEKQSLAPIVAAVLEHES
jgi:hypothetical protein